MIERAGTSVGLSVGIVILAAVVLHHPGESKVMDGPAAGPPRRDPPGARPKAEPPKAVAAKKSEAPLKGTAPRPSRQPDAPLTQVREGETFADVARRVYGESIDLDAFWRMNRDQLPTRDAEVRAGMALRTPPL